MQEAFLARYPDAEHVGNGWFLVDTDGLLFRANFEDGCTLQSGDVVEHAATFERAHVLLLRALRKALNKQFKALKIALPPPPQSPWEPPDTHLVFEQVQDTWVACIPQGNVTLTLVGPLWQCRIKGFLLASETGKTAQRAWDAAINSLKARMQTGVGFMHHHKDMVQMYERNAHLTGSLLEDLCKKQ